MSLGYERYINKVIIIMIYSFSSHRSADVGIIHDNYKGIITQKISVCPC